MSCVKVEVDVLGSVHNGAYDLCGPKATLNLNSANSSESMSCCVEVEVDVLGPAPSLINSPYGLCGRKAVLNERRN